MIFHVRVARGNLDSVYAALKKELEKHYPGNYFSIKLSWMNGYYFEINGVYFQIPKPVKRIILKRRMIFWHRLRDSVRSFEFDFEPIWADFKHQPSSVLTKWRSLIKQNDFFELSFFYTKGMAAAGLDSALMHF